MKHTKPFSYPSSSPRFNGRVVCCWVWPIDGCTSERDWSARTCQEAQHTLRGVASGAFIRSSCSCSSTSTSTGTGSGSGSGSGACGASTTSHSSIGAGGRDVWAQLCTEHARADAAGNVALSGNAWIGIGCRDLICCSQLHRAICILRATAGQA